MDLLNDFPWAHLALKLICGFGVYEFALWQSRRLDKRAGHVGDFSSVLEAIRMAPSPGLGIYYGCRYLGLCVFAAGAMYIT